ncbi:hypothetical protein C8034_v012405 [Colletotrichum sidae]|uniref:Rhodopsin domain-containing protein n=1 Tax=Colletotrichum sidae TaxID=1347389 RepID=A0A4R8T193_9PEZI|nr:hypothetical protein C8034_v012405 [Colletotrichum sidae]
MNNATGPVGAFPPPPGVIPNFDDPRDAGWTLNIAGMSVMAAVTTIFFGVRTYVKISAGNPLLPEDWTCAVAYGSIMLYIATVFVMGHYGEGYHSWELTRESYQEIMKWLYASSIIYCPAAYFTKTTLLLLEARVFATYQGAARGIRIFAIILLVSYIPIQTLKTVICIPVSAFWNPHTPNPKCLNQRKIFIADMCLAITTDLFILLIPVPLLWGLRMPLLKKLKIMVLLGAGGIATAVTIYRLYLVILFLSSTDVTADFVVLDLVTALELVIGVVCACLPSANILYERIRRSEPPHAGHAKAKGGGGYGSHSDGSSYWWSMMTGKTRAGRSEMATVAEAAAAVHGPHPHSGANFDTELAVLTGKPMGNRPPTTDTGRTSLNAEDDWDYNLRANSIDGRREGWLAPAAESSTRAAAPAKEMTWQEHELQARKSWEAVWEKAMPADGLDPGRREEGGPPQLRLTTHPLPDWGPFQPQ